MILYWWQSPCLVILSIELFITKRLRTKIENAAWHGSQWKLTYFFYFPWPPQAYDLVLMAVSLFSDPFHTVAYHKWLRTKIENAASHGSQWKLTYFFYFPWPPQAYDLVLMAVSLFSDPFHTVAYHKKTKDKNWECCLTRKPKEANIFLLLPLASASLWSCIDGSLLVYWSFL